MLETDPQRDDPTRSYVPTVADLDAERAAFHPAPDADDPLLNGNGVSGKLPVRTARYTPSEVTNVTTTTTQPGSGSDQLAQGRVELLPGEEVVHQLGAIYLTDRRVLLYTPNVIRAAHLRDVDAAGAALDRQSSAIFVLGLLLAIVGASFGGLLFFEGRGELTEGPLADLLNAVRGFLGFVPLPFALLLLLLAAVGVFFIVSYFMWLGRSLFVSVHGRPLISVSISGYRPKRLEDIDSFLNALWLAKDRLERDPQED